MSKQQRINNRRTAEWLRLKNPPKHRCINCGELTHHGHFLPPCFGGGGLFLCERKDSQ